MLKEMSPLISPELLKVLSEMGHGDEIVLSRYLFPANSYNPNVVPIGRINRFDFYGRANEYLP